MNRRIVAAILAAGAVAAWFFATTQLLRLLPDTPEAAAIEVAEPIVVVLGTLPTTGAEPADETETGQGEETPAPESAITLAESAGLWDFQFERQ